MTKPARRTNRPSADTPPPPEPQKPKAWCLELKAEEGKTRDELMAQVAADGIVGNARTMASFGAPTFGDLSLTECAMVLTKTAQELDKGDMSASVRLLSAQAIALNGIFGELARVGQLNMFNHPDYAERYLRLAFKAQAQSRATLEAIATIKNPPVVFARQANINNGGQQQVNNGAPVSGQGASPAYAEETQSRPNELLGVTHGQGLDLGAQAAAGGINQAVETVGAVNRTEKRFR
ncbi:hypothetical protein KAK07_12280 [Ideonella sp. 4Y16]|uniref:hypothetical protein n=1 Tax=Ideonella alba TaxID=2824118 RepID=UPI001B391600|nr:hypothetical protein [Ideonella alba]MBQ0944112.1 hypothetical protein [Ideonella alba]